MHSTDFATLADLMPHHLTDLRSSGLSDETIIASGFYSESNPHKLAAILGGAYAKKRGPALVIPFRDFDGDINGFKRIKPDNPRIDRNGRKVKYESPRGVPNKPYFPPGIAPLLTDTEAELIISEGEKKALAGTQAGFSTIGLVGVYGWKPDKGGDRLVPELEAVEWQGRRVYLCYDSDLSDKPEVRDAESRLAAQLINRGANVRCVRLPDGPNGEKIGLDDYLLTHDRTDIRKLLDRAEEPDPSTEIAKRPANALDPMPEARAFLDAYATHKEGKADLLTLRYHRDELVAWDGLCYKRMPEPELRCRLWEHLDPTTSHITQGTVNNILAAVRSLTLIPCHKEPPFWIDGDGPFPAGETLATQSGLLHLPSLIEGKPCLSSLTPRFFSQHALDYGFSPDEQCPTWLEFLDSMWNDDAASILTLQEIMGCLLTPDTQHHKLFMFLGPKRSGKGTIGRIIKALVGTGNLASPTLASLSGPFGLWPLLGKTVALIADARLSGRTDAISIVERLLSISGEDPQDVHRKCLPTVTGVRLPVRFVILTNELPNMRDASGALASRVILLRLTRSFYGHEDKRLTDKLLAELPGILNWSIMGWQRLRERGFFEQPATGREILDDLEELSSPIAHFVADCCVVGPEHSASSGDLFAAWKAWCEERGRDYIGTREVFGKDLRASVPSLRTSRPRGHDGRREVWYSGIRTRLDADKAWD